MLEAADMTTKPKANKSVFIGILLTSLRPTNIDTNATPKVFECYCRLSMKASSKRMMTPLIRGRQGSRYGQRHCANCEVLESEADIDDDRFGSCVGGSVLARCILAANWSSAVMCPAC